jgi:hypothetical protein
MGKASERRRKRRQEYLGQLAWKNPKKFKREWAKRLASWQREAYRRAPRLLNSKDGVFDLVPYALAQLAGCGDSAIECDCTETRAGIKTLEETDTMRIMNDACSDALAGVFDPHMHRLSNAKSNYHKMAVEGHRPPR